MMAEMIIVHLKVLLISVCHDHGSNTNTRSPPCYTNSINPCKHVLQGDSTTCCCLKIEKAHFSIHGICPLLAHRYVWLAWIQGVNHHMQPHT